MTTKRTVGQLLAELRGIATPADIRAAANAGAAAPALKNNTHIHLPPNFSAFESVAQAAALAARENVKVLGVSNYYDFTVYGEFIAQARQRGIFPLFGLEIIAMIDELRRTGAKLNDPGNPGKLYICGKGITRFGDLSSEAAQLMQIIRRNDTARMAEMIRRMERAFSAHGVTAALDLQAVIGRIVARHGCDRATVYPQERHAAQAFQEVLFEKVQPGQRLDKLAAILGQRGQTANPDRSRDWCQSPLDPVKVQNDIRAHLMKAGKPAFVEEQFVNFEEARRLILELGGIPCYPVVADGAAPVSPFEESPEKLIGNLKPWGLTCVEFITLRNKPDVLARYVSALRAAGLAVTAGTEHNTLDLVALEPACAGGAAVPAEVKEILWEGACVVAAHQFLCLHGECGFVDKQGRPNPAYKDAEERIGAFRKLGAAVVKRYLEG
ncbi:MAG: hypothetical protein ABSE73_17725 [Planctomycetota bacterium]